MTRIFDITRPLSPRTAVWPGDVPVRFTRSADHAAGDPVSSGAIACTLHAGTHLDAPLHLFAGGTGVDAVPLEACLGPALVVACGDAPALDLALLAPRIPEGTTRVLLQTAASARPDDRLEEGYPALTAEAARWLVARGARLVGVDAPSVDPFDSTDLPVHRILLGAGAVILENLALGAVPPGPYELVALPLRLVGMDGSPVRAVLRPLASPS